MVIQLIRILPILCCLSFIKSRDSSPSSPLSQFSSEWNDTKYLKCNTAGNAGYMSAKEKEVIYILNLVRTNPKLFANSVVKKYPDYAGNSSLRKVNEFKSLLKTLQNIESLALLTPDSKCYASAQCHAYSSGKRGYIGHDRREGSCRSKKYFSGECCEYGHDSPLDIVMTLLIDQNIASLPHRKICLGRYKAIGVSIQPHKAYRYNAVLDFSY